MEQQEHSAQELPASTRELAELVGERMEVGVGRWRLVLEFQDGRLARFFRNEGPVPAGAIGRFDRPA